jgi:N-acetylglucosamine malate deacetylase 1
VNARAPLPRALRAPPRGKVLVLAPHADDEVIGAGGTLALHVEAGDEVEVLVTFDGVQGLSPELRVSRGASVRREEARRAGAHLGLSRYEFWSYPEGHEVRGAELDAAVTRLAEHIASRSPAIVYAPWLGEHHLDHHVLSRAATAALARIDFRGEAWGYEVWTPLVPTCVIDVTRVWERKVAALREHASQLEHTDLLHRMGGLAAHRSVYLEPGARYGEAFAPLAIAEGSAA